jgi:adenylate cyclase
LRDAAEGRYSQRMAREKKDKAVLFADISQSSSLYKQLGDTKAHSIVYASLQTMTRVLPRHEGEVIKTLGDAIMCVFPTADLAVLAAGEMQATIASARPEDYPVGIHIGLHYGSVLVEDGDVFGDTVNVAAYLTAVAMRDQILTTEATENALSPALKSCVRPVFHTVLKGSGRDSVVYQILWKTDQVDVTDVNLDPNRVIPGDAGSLLVTLGGERTRVGHWRPTLTIGRARECDLIVTDRYASRLHLTIKAMRTRFYLSDHSINGTFVTLQGGEEVHVLHAEMPLDRSGELCLGRSRADSPREIVTFEYDRRSMFRP